MMSATNIKEIPDDLSKNERRFISRYSQNDSSKSYMKAIWNKSFELLYLIRTDETFEDVFLGSKHILCFAGEAMCQQSSFKVLKSAPEPHMHMYRIRIHTDKG